MQLQEQNSKVSADARRLSAERDPANALHLTGPKETACEASHAYGCAREVQDALLSHKEYFQRHPGKAFDLLMHWDAVFRTRAASLPKDAATSDTDKILEKVKEKVDPVEWLRDNIKDQVKDYAKESLERLVQRYLCRLSTVSSFVISKAPVADVFFAAFSSSEVASDIDELKQANLDVQRTFLFVMDPLLRRGWEVDYAASVRNVLAGPQILPK